MRIAYLSADYGVPVLGGKGSSVHVQQLIAGFAADGHEVVLFCARRGAGDHRKLSARIVEVPAPARPQSPLEGSSSGETASGSERLAKERDWLARASSIEDCIVAEHAARPFDFVYERYSLWSRAGVNVARRTGLPCIVEVNAPLVTEAETYRKLEMKAEAVAIEADVFRGADALVAVSEAVGRYAISKGAALASVRVIPNGVNANAFDPDVAPAAVSGLQREHRVIGFVGGLKPWHGLQELLQAFARVSQSHRDARLLIVGDGPMRGWIEGFLAGTGLADRVVVTGWVAHDALPGLVARMDIATAPYPQLDDFYFSPLKLFEYMSTGRAIVASRIGQIDGILRDGANGLLVSPGCVEELAAGLVRLLDDSHLAQRLGQAAHTDAAAYTWAGNARQAAMIGARLRDEHGGLVNLSRLPA